MVRVIGGVEELAADQRRPGGRQDDDDGVVLGPWLLWIVIAYAVSTLSSWAGASRRMSSPAAKAARSTDGVVDDDAGVAVGDAQAEVVAGREQRPPGVEARWSRGRRGRRAATTRSSGSSRRRRSGRGDGRRARALPAKRESARSASPARGGLWAAVERRERRCSRTPRRRRAQRVDVLDERQQVATGGPVAVPGTEHRQHVAGPALADRVGERTDR